MGSQPDMEHEISCVKGKNKLQRKNKVAKEKQVADFIII